MLQVSDAVMRQAEAALGKSAEGSRLFTGIHGNLELGYLLQQRSKSMHGFGHSFTAGLRVQYDDVGARVSSKLDNVTSYKAQSEVRRTDVLGGPFVRYNLIF